MDKIEKKRPEGPGIFVKGLHGHDKPYPAWRYHELFEPITVQNTDEDEQAALAGWKTMDTPITGVQHLSNWRHDLEDMTAKQLVLFALEEFGVKLPVEAGEVRLVKAMWHLTHLAPQHSGRICLLAQSIEMDYDATIQEIKDLAEGVEFTEVKEVIL